MVRGHRRRRRGGLLEGFERPPIWALVVMVVGLVAIAVMIPLGRSHPSAASSEASESPPALTTSAAPSSSQSPAPQVPITSETKFDGKSALPPSADTGQALGVVTGQRSSTGFTVANGLLTHGQPIGRDAASYVEAELATPVQRVGAEVVFGAPGGPSGAQSGSIALISWQKSLTAARNKSSPDAIPNGGIHFVADPSGWHFGVWDGTAGREDVLARGEYDKPVRADGVTHYTIEVTRSGSTAWVVLPGGSISKPITDPRIADWSGPWATWELYEFQPGLQPASFARVWAG